MLVEHILKTVLFSEIIVGLKTTIKHMFVKDITEQYPHEKKVPPNTYRGVMSLLLYRDGSEKCVGCCLCEAYCPSNCIRVVPTEDPSVPGKRYAKEYYLNIARCVFCGYCVEACPVNALAMTPDYEHSEQDRRKLYFDKSMLLEMGVKFKERSEPYLEAHGMGRLTEQVREYPFPTDNR